MKRIAVLGSGGDAPGMNACVRAVVRSALHHGMEVFGVRDGYKGLIENDVIALNRGAVSNIIQRGGIFLGSGRSEEFRTPEGRTRAAAVLRGHEIEALVALGGEGTLGGAMELSREWDVAAIVLPATIDNDVPGTDVSIGFDTAVNTALESVDRIRDTAEATERVFFVEVMGRESGALAIEVGIAAGADAILIPEVKTTTEELARQVRRSLARRSRSIIVIVSEGEIAGGAFTVAKQLEPFIDREIRVTVLGHVQRGGMPTAVDRVLATRLGVAAVDTLVEGKKNCMLGEIDCRLRLTPFEELRIEKRKASLELIEMSADLA